MRTAESWSREARYRWLKQVGRVVRYARERLDASQSRAKRNFDLRRRNRIKDIRDGDWVLLRVEKSSARPGKRHKLAKVAEGPFQVIMRKSHTAIIQRGIDKEEVNCDRLELTRAPSTELQEATRQSRNRSERPSEEGYAIDRLVDHFVNDDGTMEFAVKWQGYDDVTWKPVVHMPNSKVRRYCQRKSLRLPTNIQETRTG